MSAKATRRSVNTASPHFSATPHTLSDAAIGTILEALDMDVDPKEPGDRAQWVRELIERDLGGYFGFVANADNAPRPSEYVGALSPIRDDAFRLANDLGNLPGYFFHELDAALRAEKTDIYAVENALTQLHAAAGKLAGRFAAQGSRGRPKRVALRWVVAALSATYARFTQAQPGQRATVGNQSNLTAWEAQRLDFIKAALRDADIPYPRDLQAIVREVGPAS